MAKAKAKRKPGRPAFKPTAEQRRHVKATSGFGVPQDQICQHVLWPNGKPINHETLALHFREELDSGVAQANSQVCESTFLQAVGKAKVVEITVNAAGQETDRRTVQERVLPVPTMGIWWEKTRMGKKESVAVQHTGKDGEPLSPLQIILNAPGTQ